MAKTRAWIPRMAKNRGLVCVGEGVNRAQWGDTSVAGLVEDKIGGIATKIDTNH